jgi:hypothetical protein
MLLQAQNPQYETGDLPNDNTHYSHGGGNGYGKKQTIVIIKHGYYQVYSRLVVKIYLVLQFSRFFGPAGKYVCGIKSHKKYRCGKQYGYKKQ